MFMEQIEQFLPAVLGAGWAATAAWAALALRRRAGRVGGDYQAMFEASNAVMLIVDPRTHRILDANAAAVAYYGWSRRELLARRITDINTLPPEALAGHLRNCLAKRRERSECHHRNAAGEIRDVESHDTAIQWGGRPAIFKIVHDISERRYAERQARQLSRAVAQTPASVVITDATGAIEYVNPAFTRVTGYALDEVLGQNPRVLKSGNMPPETYVQMWRTITSGQEWRGELQNKKKNGELYWELASIAPLADESGMVTNFVAVKEDITVRKAMEEELRAAARADKLTGLPNRAMLCDRLGQAVLRWRRDPAYKFAVLFLDFDRFKVINDSLGHTFGDLLLVEISRRLREAVRDVDSVSRCTGGNTAARLGGDEFIVLLEGIRATSDAELVASRLLSCLGDPYVLQEHQVFCNASIGIVTSDVAAERAEDFLRDADTAMYEAKLAGKGRFVVFNESMRQRVRHRLNMENDIRRAMEEEQFVLHYQPIVDLATGELEAFEALVRWNHPQRGLISPAEFVPIAEETGLIIPLGEWTVREACTQLQRWWKASGRRYPRSLAINLSRNHLGQTESINRIKGILAETGVDPSAIHLEITESAVMHDVRFAVDYLQQLKGLGVKLDIDDFGTGYSSLSCLHQFPVDVLKIDRSFITNLARGRDFTALVNAIIALAGHLHIRVIAEGVETADQLSMLQALDCPYAQGYFFGKPMPADEAIRWRKPRLEANAA